LALSIVASMASAQGAPMPPAGPMEVGVVELTRQDVPRAVTLPGRAVASQEVLLRPRVGGVIEEILYTPGQPLAVGAPLFRIDDAAYAAAEASARATLATAEANLPVAQSAYDRATQLAGRGFTEAEVEQARASLAEAEATLEAAQAALDYAQTELSWTTVTSPIAGRADVPTVSVGDLVTAGQSDELTTIVRADPIYVDMMEASARILSFRKGIDEGSITRNDDLEATLRLENGDVYRGTGKMVTPGNSVSTTTGTVTVRFQFDNPHNIVIPGMFLRGEIVIGTIQAYLVPQRAAVRDSAGKLTAYLAGEDGTAHQVTLTEDGSYQNSWIVREGVNEGDQLIIDGLSSLKAGQAVVPITATIDADGNVQDLDSRGAED
jgi:membrane fusion protein (multidrug efflux system)